MFNTKLFWYLFTLTVIFLWVFIIYGFFTTFNNTFVYYTWLVLAIVFLIGHLTEIKKAIPIGKKAGHSTPKIVILTYIFGITYWYPVKYEIYK